LRATSHSEGLPVGQAVATTAGRLPAQWVIHTVGPVYSETTDRSDMLRSCYQQSLRVAESVGARSIAFPAISAGAYGWRIGDAARIAVATVRGADTTLDEVRFVLFESPAQWAFEDATRG